ncbi:hypothetical protein M9H77_24789 [Catharanthus roseus]|uniref:Uncharacterized protein n=1 Tax=Catharanthus roseus TaxID=4058 RepID=A0ACC0A924_CATRO|nr:hypothetical protein M9H77_24789 [Catharanthus roseus]
MACCSSSSSLAFPALQPKFPSSQRSTSESIVISTRLINVRPVITASVSERPSVKPPKSRPAPAPPSPVEIVTQSSTKLPIRKIPGDCGLPLIGPWKDRQDYFYNQGKEEYFKSRIQKYHSTVFRTNMPPGPFISFNPNVIVLLDGKSFPVLFDVSKVEKKDLFTGTFMPSTELTGGYRVLSYLDPSEPNHGKLKKLLFFHLSSRRDHVIPEFHNSYSELFDGLEDQLSTNGKANFNQGNDQAAFNFLARSLYGVNPADTKLGLDGPKLIGKWVLFNLHPVLRLGLPNGIEDLLIHTFRLPPALVKKDYQSLYNFFYENSNFVLEEAERIGISRDEACHNLVFATCFNSFGGMKILFPNMMKWIGRAGVKLHTQLAQEIRSVLKSFDNKITMRALENMPLMKSVVYEALRIEPPVPAQYGRAKKDLIIESHDAAFKVKEGELIFGFQPFATKDPKIFHRSEEFVPDRFVGEEGEKLLKHVLWSNGPETESPNVHNKQCAGKDFVVLVSRLLLVEFFQRYDSFDIEVGASPLGASVTVTSLKRATTL